MRKIAIIGASGHGKVIADIAKKTGYESIIFFDDDKTITECSSYRVLGKTMDALKFDGELFVGIGNPSIRKRIFDIIPVGKLATLIHPAAIVASDVIIEKGSVVMAGAVINSGAKIGKGCIINTSSSVDHDCIIGDFVHVAVGAHLCGSVIIGDETWIGAGTIVSNNVNICSNCMIGSGTVVVKNIDVAGTYIGVPARVLKKKGVQK